MPRSIRPTTELKAIIHCHSAKLWKRLLGIAAHDAAEVEYGTPEMADEVARLFAETDVRKYQIFVMAGHADGVIAFGRTLAEACDSDETARSHRLLGTRLLRVPNRVELGQAHFAQALALRASSSSIA